jgi:DNA-binding Lrp family transcriptional regulator
VADIARYVGLERDTTQKRISKLSDLGALQRRYEVDLDALGYTNRYLMDITVDPKELKDAHKAYVNKANKYERQQRRQKRSSRSKAAQRPSLITNPQVWLAIEIMKLNDKPENKDVIVQDLAVMMGDPADLCATVRTRGDQKVIFNFVTDQVRPIPGIQKTSTCIEAWSVARDRVIKQAALAKQSASHKNIRSKKKTATQTSAPASV